MVVLNAFAAFDMSTDDVGAGATAGDDEEASASGVRRSSNAVNAVRATEMPSRTSCASISRSTWSMDARRITCGSGTASLERGESSGVDDAGVEASFDEDAAEVAALWEGSTKASADARSSASTRKEMSGMMLLRAQTPTRTARQRVSRAHSTTCQRIHHGYRVCEWKDCAPRVTTL